MLHPDPVALVDDELSPILSRYRSLSNLLRLSHSDPDDLALFLDDTNDRLAQLLDRLAGVSHEN